jgi:hypothetical protein
MPRVQFEREVPLEHYSTDRLKVLESEYGQRADEAGSRRQALQRRDERQGARPHGICHPKNARIVVDLAKGREGERARLRFLFLRCSFTLLSSVLYGEAPRVIYLWEIFTLRSISPFRFYIFGLVFAGYWEDVDAARAEKRSQLAEEKQGLGHRREGAVSPLSFNGYILHPLRKGRVSCF